MLENDVVAASKEGEAETGERAMDGSLETSEAWREGGRETKPAENGRYKKQGPPHGQKLKSKPNVVMEQKVEHATLLDVEHQAP